MKKLWYWLMMGMFPREAKHCVIYANLLERKGKIKEAYDLLCKQEGISGFQPDFWYWNNLGYYAMTLSAGSNPMLLKIAEDAFGHALELDPASDLLKANRAKLAELIKNSPAPLPEDKEKPTADRLPEKDEVLEPGPDFETLDDFFGVDDKAGNPQDKKPSPPQEESKGKGAVPPAAGKQEQSNNVLLCESAFSYFLEAMVYFVEYFKAEIDEEYYKQLMAQIKKITAEGKVTNADLALDRAARGFSLATDLLDMIRRDAAAEANKASEQEQGDEADQPDSQTENQAEEPPQADQPAVQDDNKPDQREMVDPPPNAPDPKHREMMDPPPGPSKPPRAKVPKVKK